MVQPTRGRNKVPEKKEPMIGRQDRPTAIDFDAPIANFKLRDLYAVIHSQLHTEKEILKVEKEHVKPEKEKEHFKPEKEKEYFKPEKELLKPEKELSKPELSKPIDPRLIDQIVETVIERMKAKGMVK